MCTNVNPRTAFHTGFNPAAFHALDRNGIDSKYVDRIQDQHAICTRENFFDFSQIFDCSGCNFGQILHFSAVTQTLAIKVLRSTHDESLGLYL